MIVLSLVQSKGAGTYLFHSGSLKRNGATQTEIPRHRTEDSKLLSTWTSHDQLYWRGEERGNKNNKMDNSLPSCVCTKSGTPSQARMHIHNMFKKMHRVIGQGHYTIETGTYIVSHNRWCQWNSFNSQQFRLPNCKAIACTRLQLHSTECSCSNHGCTVQLLNQNFIIETE